ncbi:HNH endonuclease [Raoultella terrigena]|uniref:HNH endonuclease n=1 Tax=Raoultella terrigena TaxID=577 RepID=UPI0015BB43BC|nr:hypothetical protein [Raoultella terrigena]NWK89387.1 hypothetical protein [Raoultella terrigena]
MFFHNRKQALAHFHSRYNEDEFICVIKFHEVFGKYSYAIELNPLNNTQRNIPTPPLRPQDIFSSPNKSIADTTSNSKKQSSKFGSFTTDSLLKPEKKGLKKTINLEDEPLSDEAIRAVIASQAKRKKPVPYVREEFTSISPLKINQHDSDRPRCIYCGDYNSGIVRDHIVSVAWRGGVRHYDRRHTVPSCPQCNNLLGDKPLHNIADRAAFLVGAIEHHERRYLSTVDRTAEELEELDHFLAISVKNAMYEKAIAIQRIEYVKQVAAGYYDYATIKHLVKQGRDIREE